MYMYRYVCNMNTCICVHMIHPVSITRFPLRQFSPGAGLLRNPFVQTINAKTFPGLGPKRRESSNGDRVYGFLAADWRLISTANIYTYTPII